MKKLTSSLFKANQISEISNLSTIRGGTLYRTTMAELNGHDASPSVCGTQGDVTDATSASADDILPPGGCLETGGGTTSIDNSAH